MNSSLSTPQSNQRKYFILLSCLLALFCGRVGGQLIVAIWHVPFLPPMQEWFSELMPYPALLTYQLLIIALYAKVCSDFAKGKGFFCQPKHAFGEALLQFGSLYLAVMIIRYIIRMSLYSTERWTGGCIPIFFHYVLASFILALGWYHFSSIGPSSKTERKHQADWTSKVTKSLVGVSITGLVLLWIGYQLLPAYLSHQSGLRGPLYAVHIQKHVAMESSDGDLLIADIYQPQHLKSSPTMLLRLPYSKSLETVIYANILGRMWSERGYTVVIPEQGAKQ